MFHNPYTELFNRVPATIQEQSTNLMRFFDSNSSLQPPRIQLFPQAFSSILSLSKEIVRDYLTHSALSDDSLLTQPIQHLFSLPPPLFQQRTFVGFTDVKCSYWNPGSFIKMDQTFDEEGNLSLFTLLVVLHTKQDNSECIMITHPSPSRIQLHNGQAILWDHRIACSNLSIPKDSVLVLQLQCLYSLLPESTTTLPLYEQIVLWRGRMRKCFINSGNFTSKKSILERIQIHDLEHPLKDQCDSCLQFIPITSTSCPVCGDRLASIPSLITSRQKGIWVSKSIY